MSETDGVTRQLGQMMRHAAQENDPARENKGAAAGPLALRVEFEPGGGAGPGFRGETVPLGGAGEGVRITVGRAPNNTLAVANDSQVSKRHCRIEGGVLTDLGSTNGTFVNDLRLRSPHILRAGDVIRCGTTRVGQVTGPRARPGAGTGTMVVVSRPTLSDESDGGDGPVADDAALGFFVAPGRRPADGSRRRIPRPDPPASRRGSVADGAAEAAAEAAAAEHEDKKKPGIIARIFRKKGKRRPAEEEGGIPPSPDGTWKNDNGTMRYGSPPGTPRRATPERASRPGYHHETIRAAPPARNATLRLPGRQHGAPAGPHQQCDTLRAPVAATAATPAEEPVSPVEPRLRTPPGPPGGVVLVDGAGRAPPFARRAAHCSACAGKDEYIDTLQEQVLDLQEQLSAMRGTIKASAFVQAHRENSAMELDQSNDMLVALQRQLTGRARQFAAAAAARSPPPPPPPPRQQQQQQPSRQAPAPKSAIRAAPPRGNRHRRRDGRPRAVGRPTPKGKGRPGVSPPPPPRRRAATEYPLWRHDGPVSLSSGSDGESD